LSYQQKKDRTPVSSEPLDGWAADLREGFWIVTAGGKYDFTGPRGRRKCGHGAAETSCFFATCS